MRRKLNSEPEIDVMKLFLTLSYSGSRYTLCLPVGLRESLGALEEKEGCRKHRNFTLLLGKLWTMVMDMHHLWIKVALIRCEWGYDPLYVS